MSVRAIWMTVAAAIVVLLGAGVAASMGLASLAVPVAATSGVASTEAAQPTLTPFSSSTASATATPASSARPAPAATANASPEPSTPPLPTPTKKPATAGLVAVTAVIDGDTIKVRVGGITERVRIIGIDTPELKGGECFAQQAASAMQSLVQSKSVRLVRDPSQADRDRYDRLLRHVALADGRQVAQVLIAGGFGEEFTYAAPYAGQAAYKAAEASARGARKGIWSSGCRAPRPAVAPPTTPKDCLIKGNIANDGEKIYHLPGQRYYEVTKISESKGERWFCSESQARDAGWRPAEL